MLASSSCCHVCWPATPRRGPSRRPKTAHRPSRHPGARAFREGDSMQQGNDTAGYGLRGGSGRAVAMGICHLHSGARPRSRDGRSMVGLARGASGRENDARRSTTLQRRATRGLQSCRDNIKNSREHPPADGSTYPWTIGQLGTWAAGRYLVLGPTVYPSNSPLSEINATPLLFGHKLPKHHIGARCVAIPKDNLDRPE